MNISLVFYRFFQYLQTSTKRVVEKTKHAIPVTKTNFVKIFSNTYILFVLCLLAGIAISEYQHADLFWDFLNYHYNNAYAFISGRFDYDIVPSSINGFFNPIIELPLYFYIKYFNDNLPLIYALQGIWGGLLLFAFYQICTLVFDVTKFSECSYTSLAVIIAMTGQMTFFQIGYSTNEIPIAFFILWGLYYVLRSIKHPPTQNLKTFFVAGLLMGIGLGLKQTVVGYCFSAGMMLIICYKYLKTPFKSIFIFAVGGLTGYLLINGYFMYKFTVNYGNPFFPFLNGIFHSPYFDDFNYRDARFIPKGWAIFYAPYKWAHIVLLVLSQYSHYMFKNVRIEMNSIDLRLVLYHTFALILPLWILCQRRMVNFVRTEHLKTSLFIFFFCSYFTWLLLFSIPRYSVVFEVLGSIWLVLVLKTPISKYKILNIPYKTFWILFTALLVSNPFLGTNHGYDERYKSNLGKGQYVYVEPVHLPDNTLLKLYNFPTAGIIPEFAKYSKNFRAIGFMHDNCVHHEGTDFVERGEFRKIRDEIIKNHTGPVVIVYSDTSLDNNKLLQEHFNDRKICEKLKDSEAMQNLLKQTGRAPLIEKLQKSPIMECMSDRCPIWLEIQTELEKVLEPGMVCRKLKTNLNNTLHICAQEWLYNTLFWKEEQ